MIITLRWSFAFLLVTWSTTSLAVKTSSESKLTGLNACSSKQTCHDCIRTPSCAWCSMPGYSDKRCFLPHINKISMECPNDYTINPDNEYKMDKYKELTKGSYNAVKGLEEKVSTESKGHESSSASIHTETHSSSSTSTSSKNEAVQLYPQEVTLKLRINEVQKIKIEFAQAEDYPVDLYYLMDLSNSMKDDKQKLSDLGQLLVESMSKITSNFHLGFGSFVDKVVMPYVNMASAALKHPCDGCAAPYGYRNHMPLSNNSTDFASKVREAPVSGNLDAPEGGFDAIMQAIVCRDEIGWREKARKLLLFSTDASFHYAGDGKLGGIVKPNDGLCHMDKEGLYTHSTLQDYPSISQINLKVKENSVNIIWAVTEEQIRIYSNLTNHIQGSYAAKLSNDSSNIVDLVREQYNAISSSLEMKDTASNYIDLKYYSNCLNGGSLIETNKCDGLKVGDKVEFTVEVEVKACPENRADWKQKFMIYPVGINESLTVNLEMICDCECERADSINQGFEPHSQQCSARGDLSCGICACDDGYFGKQCECGTNDRGIISNKEFACRKENTTTYDCSGRGSCECNVCQCYPREDPNETVWGDFCECDNFSCDRRNKELCSGPTHGKCNCGVCECQKEWSGKACECSTKRDKCDVNGVECSGHGVCECNQCKCQPDGDTRYSGTFCHICLTCPNRCEELKPCVLCTAFKAGNLTEVECNSTCSQYDYEIVETIDVDLDKEEIGCHGYDEQDCKYFFAYIHDVLNNTMLVRIQKQRECPPQVYVLGIVLGVIAAVVLIGLALLLLWKLLTTIHDRREFAKFEKERMMAKWDASENPIYKQATSTFKNPMYTASNIK
ncbi:integrin beta-PS [Nasonia vitripennis]|uniref:Integrin beta n=1 Tax=Nasonia vitripennis TaxID=7425 RepID=A0A7M7G6Q6_NASVI|nr:integrin beta-PS [Nasonia vitripennis]